MHENNNSRKFQSIKHLTILSIAFLLLNILPVYAIVPSEPHPANAIWIEPSTITLTDYNIGDKFNITAYLNMTTLEEGAIGITAWQVVVYYNTTYIKATRVGFTGPGYTVSELFSGHSTVPSTKIEPSKSRVGCGETLLGADYVPVPVVASLCWIEFEVIALQPQPIKFKLNIDNPLTYICDDIPNYYPPSGNTELYDATVKSPVTYPLTITSTTGGTTDPAPGAYTYPGDTIVTVRAIPITGYILDHWELDGANVGNPNPIHVTMDADHTLHAVFTSLGTILYVDPPEIIDPTITPSNTFAVNVTIDDVGDMLTCEFNLTYANILSLMGIEVFRVQGQKPSLKMMVDDDVGYLWVKLNYPSPVTTTTPTPLVRITFHVDEMGVTPLDLTNTILTDSTGEPIPHTAIDGFFAALIQDLSITNVVVSNNWVYKGQPVNINVTVKNFGNQKESFDVETYYDTTLIGTQHFTDLAPNAETILTFTWDTSATEPCRNYTITANVTILPHETNIADNTYTDGNVKVYARDIAVTNVVASSNWVYQGWVVEINVTAKNFGDLNESFDVSVYYDSTLIETKHVTDLPPNEEIILTFGWNTSLVQPCHNYTITGEVASLPYEQNVTNNVYQDGNVKVRIMGDVNGDGTVDMKDIHAIGEAFLSSPDDPKWNPDADLDKNGTIDMKDVRLACINFLMGCY
ncbi:MAG: CARDB domain-containing protein [Candidatus Bathyarchaeia archaeon]